MSKALADNAVKALTAPGYDSVAGHCQKWVRQNIQKVYGSRFDAYHKASAAESMAAWKGSPYAVKPDMSRPDRGTQVGDILYKGTKTSGRYGHVGIRVVGNKIAENSSSHVSENDREARGTRSIAAFGDFELIVRLPEPAKK